LTFFGRPQEGPRGTREKEKCDQSSASITGIPFLFAGFWRGTLTRNCYVNAVEIKWK
jgi:hypothetical protein